mmetsp:Transcript_29728/g.45544  ORF Transcript_29728/g.45544 Transcript_29728/m.45544 type:complete len:177 (+) Transcript_29728:396-926(+)
MKYDKIMRKRARRLPTTTTTTNKPSRHAAPLFFRRRSSSSLEFEQCNTDIDDEEEQLQGIMIEEKAHARETKKHVSFSHCEVRDYKRIVGDHPKCKKGLPLAIGWEHSETTRFYSVDEHECLLSHKRQQQQQQSPSKLNALERRRILRSVMRYSNDYLDRMEEKRRTMCDQPQQNQ